MPNFPVRPKVQCLRTPKGERIANPALEEIDLSLAFDLEIAAVDGLEVRHFAATLEAVETSDELLGEPV